LECRTFGSFSKDPSALDFFSGIASFFDVTAFVSFLSASDVFFTCSFDFFSTVFATSFTIEGTVVGLVRVETDFLTGALSTFSYLLLAGFVFSLATDADRPVEAAPLVRAPSFPGVTSIEELNTFGEASASVTGFCPGIAKLF